MGQETKKPRIDRLFDLSGRVAIVTGGAGLLGKKHGEILAEAGASVVVLDVHGPAAEAAAKALTENHGTPALGLKVDISNPAEVAAACDTVLKRFAGADILLNNASNNPKAESMTDSAWSRFENFPLAQWQDDIAVGVTGAFLCSQVFGAQMAKQKRGVIVNVASDLAVIAPDQRIYRQDGQTPDRQPVKPVTYSVVKTGLLGLTRYLATYWAADGVRVNAISPGGIYNGQPDAFVQKLSNLIPLGRMAHVDEYQGAILFLCSDASSYMTGTNLIIDGGRTCW